MKLAAFASACFALAILGAPALADEQCPPLRVVASVDMITMPGGRVVVPMRVAGETLYFWIGTAAPYTAISASVANAHHLPVEHSNIYFIDQDGDVYDKMTTVPSFGIGRLLSGRTQLLMVNHDAPTVNGITPVGTLGADFLRAYDVDLDFGAGKLNLISRDHCDENPVYWESQTIAKLPMLVTDVNKITFKMSLDGHELQTVLNTAMTESTIKLSTAKSLYDIDNSTPGNKTVGHMPDGTQLFAHRFQSLSVDGLMIANPLLILLPSKADAKIEHLDNVWRRAAPNRALIRQQPELELGMAELRHLHIYIDYHHQMIYLTPASSTATASRSTLATH